jgi:hypothetical protein
MQKEEITKLFDEFLKSYDEEEKTSIWKEHSQTFRDFWNNKILNSNVKEINEAEVDQIIKILDRYGKGNTKSDEAVARVMVPQGAWRRMFKEIKENGKLHDLLNKIFIEENGDKKIISIDELYKFNQGRRNNLTGASGSAINAMLFTFNPDTQMSAVSLNDRKRVIDYFNFSGGPDFDKDTTGRKIVISNQCIINGYHSLGLNVSPRTFARFLYSSPIKELWKTDSSLTDELPVQILSEVHEKEIKENVDIALFYMESQLEDFLIENWDKTALGKKYDLIEEDGELVSQQYRTDIGTIDILAQDKVTKEYIVIELKRNQTSDDTVGQLCRYRGWLKKHKTQGKKVKGIIIAARYDERLDYALQDVNDVEVYLYRVDFHLREFRESE